MSDLRLEDLRAMDSVDGVIVGRRVSRREVLEALGAWKLWLCWGNDPEDSCDQHSYFEEGSNEHAHCGLHWVVTDAT